MTAPRRRSPATPLSFAAGLLVFIVLLGACHRRPAPAPTPARPARAPERHPEPPAAITSGQTLLRSMRELYSESWYRTVTFRQRTTLVNPLNGHEIVQTWYEAASLPGKLRIDTDVASKAGYIFRRDSVYAFGDGKLVSADTGTNELLLLGFDAYTQPSTRTEAQLRRLGFDLSKIHESTWQGRPVWVVGALRGDSTSKQFWVDHETLLFVRLLERSARGRTDTRFNNYQRIGHAWIATQVQQFQNGKVRLREDYTDIRVDVPLVDAMFEPKEWAAAARLPRP